MADYNEIERALSYVTKSDDRELWVRMGAGIKTELGDDGFDIWDRWSSQADNYNSNAAKATWKSLKPGRVNIGSVFHEAKQGGYTPEKKAVKTFSKEELAEKAKARQEREAQAIADRLAAADIAKDKAQALFKNAGQVNPNHPYLIKKGITDPAILADLRQQGNNLLVPVKQNGEIVAVQKITHGGGKYFGKDEMLTGSAFLIGDAKKAKDGLILTEGLATGASLYAATNRPVLVVFAAHNLVAVAETLKNAKLPIIFAADNDSHTKNAGFKYAEKAVTALNGHATIRMPEFTEQDNARYQERHGAGKFPSDFNDLHEIRGLDAVRQVMAGEPVATVKKTDQEQITEVSNMTEKIRNAYERAKNGEAIAPAEKPEQQMVMTEAVEPLAAVKKEQEPVLKADNMELQEPDYLKDIPFFDDANPNEEFINGIEVDLEYIKAKSMKSDELGQEQHEAVQPKPIKQDAGSIEQPEPVKNTVQPESKATLEEQQPVTDLKYKAPPETLKDKYLYADGLYLDQNGRTTVFKDTGTQLKTAKSDLQTVHDMVEVAKEKGWSHIKLSGKNEFKRQAFLEAESQGIKTSGYYPTPEDLAALKNLQDERALNKLENVPEQTKEGKEKEQQSEGVNSGTLKTTEKEQQSKGLNSGILKAHGAAPYLHEEKNKGSYFVTLQQGDKEHTVWGVGLPDALNESNAQPGDEVSLKNLGRQPVEVTQAVYGEDGKTIVGHETIQTYKNVWEVDVLNKSVTKEQEPAKEPLKSFLDNEPATVKKEPEKEPEKDQQALAASEAAKLKSQNQMPTAAQVETSAKADIDSDVKVTEIGGQAVSSEVKIVADKMAQPGKSQGLDSNNLAKLIFYRNMATKVVANMKVDFKQDAMRNFDTNMDKAINGTTLNVPQPLQTKAEKQQQLKQEHTKQNEMELER